MVHRLPAGKVQQTPGHPPDSLPVTKSFGHIAKMLSLTIGIWLGAFASLRAAWACQKKLKSLESEQETTFDFSPAETQFDATEQVAEESKHTW